MSVPISNTFGVKVSKPIDDRFVAADISSRNALLFKYPGLIVYVGATDTSYELKADLTTCVPLGLSPLEDILNSSNDAGAVQIKNVGDGTDPQDVISNKQLLNAKRNTVELDVIATTHQDLNVHDIQGVPAASALLTAQSSGEASNGIYIWSGSEWAKQTYPNFGYTNEADALSNLLIFCGLGTEAGKCYIRNQSFSPYKFISIGGDTLGYTAEDVANKGVANGYTPLNSSTKIDLAYLPDAILGQVLYGGIVDASTAIATLTNNAKAKLGTASSSITLTNDATAITGYVANEGIYYITTVAGTFAGIALEVGDWLISIGSAWKKVDNTDAVSSVNGQTGAVNLTTANVSASTDKNYVTDAQQTKIVAIDQAVSSAEKSTWNSKQNTMSIASDAEMQTGTDNVKYTTALRVATWWTWIKNQTQTVTGGWTFAGGIAFPMLAKSIRLNKTASTANGIDGGVTDLMELMAGATTNAGTGTLAAVSTTNTKSIAFTLADAVRGFAGGTDGAFLFIQNQRATTFVLNHEDGAETAANRIFTGGRNLSLGTYGSVILQYKSANARWNVVSIFGSVYWSLLAGSGSRCLEVDANGVGSATKAFVDLYITDSTNITNLENAANWAAGVYSGAAITGETKGKVYYGTLYMYVMTTSSVPKRLIYS